MSVPALDPSVQAAMVTAYQGGDTVATLAARHNVSSNRARSALLRAGVQMRPKGARSDKLVASAARKARILAAANEGHTVAELCATFGLSESWVRALLKRAGITPPRKPPKVKARPEPKPAREPRPQERSVSIIRRSAEASLAPLGYRIFSVHLMSGGTRRPAPMLHLTLMQDHLRGAEWLVATELE